MAKKRAGRKRGSRNRGYWYRSGRGWYVTEGRSSVKLCDAYSQHLRDPEDEEEVEKAYARYVLEHEPQSSCGVTVADVAQVYLDYAKKHGAEGTFTGRHAILYDFVTGFPARFRRGTESPEPRHRIHHGYGSKLVSELTGADLRAWLDAHPTWSEEGIPTRAVKRAINYAVDMGMVPANPVSRFKAKPTRKRVTYFTEEQEKTLYEYANPELAMAIRVMIRTGARPHCEYAALEDRHVEETSRGQRWRFSADEAKIRHKERIIYVDPETAATVQRQIRRYSGPRVFRNTQDNLWTPRALGGSFEYLKKRMARDGIELDDDACLYTCRHTYAKRRLGGFWGPPVSLEILAGLMGNTPQICWQYYAQWCDAYTDPLWDAVSQTGK